MRMYEPQVFPEALPLTEPSSAPQPEGRGDVILTREHMAPSLFEKVASAVDPAEAAIVAAALRAWENRPRGQAHVFQQVSDVTDGTTGNLVLPLYTCPVGNEAHVTFVCADATGSATVIAPAPQANAASWAYLAIGQGIGGSNDAGISNALAASLRRSLVAFLPTSAAGPMLPGTWTWNDANAPIVFGGETLCYVIVGGSQAGLQSVQVTVSYRVNVQLREGA